MLRDKHCEPDMSRLKYIRHCERGLSKSTKGNETSMSSFHGQRSAGFINLSKAVVTNSEALFSKKAQT